MSARLVEVAVPTGCGIEVYILYAGNIYHRPSLVFGEKEPITVRYWVYSAILGIPLVNVDIDVYLDDRKVGTYRTDWQGAIYVLFERGIPAGDHTIRCVWPGDFWNAPCEKSINIRTVKMVESYFKVYVDSLAASPGAIEAELMNSLLRQEIGAVVSKIEVDTERTRYIFTILVPEENTTTRAMLFPWALIPLIIGAIAAVLFAYAVAVYITVVYLLGQYQCGICGARFTTCEALREHIITQHPDAWEKIKDRFECAPPAPPIPWEWLIYGGIAVLGLIAVAELIRAVR